MRRALGVFAAAFAVYAAALPPSLAPYRDSGEMAAGGWTLGVYHPTSYPLYALLARLACAVPLGDPAHRLSLLSAFFAALAAAAVFELCRRRWGLLAGAGAALLLGLNPVFWSVAVVQEMYTLWVLLACAALALALRLHDAFDERLWLGLCAFFGLALGNRLDLLLWAPGLLWLAMPGGRTASPGLWAGLAFVAVPAVMAGLGSNFPIVFLLAVTAVWLAGSPRLSFLARSAAFGALGFAVYLYLPLRSARGPWLDWNHPAAAANLLETLLRTKYGGTLDLISKNYSTGELFGANLRLYGRHLWDAFSAAGLAAAAAGVWSAARRSPRRALGQAALYFWYGPFFLFLANMPPNPHAAAIVEPHYLLSDLVLTVFAAEGLSLLAERPAALGLTAAGLLAAVPLARGLVGRESRRWHLYDYDYAKSVLRSAPPGATLVLKEDVPLYTLWYYQTARGLRPDVKVLAQGLAGSPWYEEGWRRRDPAQAVVELRDEEGWARLAAADAPLLASTDAQPPASAAAQAAPRGLLSALTPPRPSPAQAAGLWELIPLRGGYDYESAPDFFTSDLIEAYSDSLFKLGVERLTGGEREAARGLLLRAWSLHWLFPGPPAYLGYMAYQAGDMKEARRCYALAAALSERLVALAGDYHALPPVLQAVRRDAADNLMQLGVALDKLHDRDGAARAYERSLSYFPTAQAHFDYAVLYWGRDWSVVERELEAALQLDPKRADVARYLAQARSLASRR